MSRPDADHALAMTSPDVVQTLVHFPETITFPGDRFRVGEAVIPGESLINIEQSYQGFRLHQS